MDKLDRLCNKVEPFAALFWARGILPGQHLTLPASPASLHCRTGSMTIQGHA